jgi:hypothetical protein
MPLKGKRVLIFQQRDWAIKVGHSLAINLQKEGCELSAVTLKRRTDQFVNNQKDVAYKYIVNIDDINEDPEKFLGGEDISLEEICRELGVDSVWPMLYSNRLMTRSYGEKFYYSYRQNLPDEFIVTYLKAYYKSLRDLFRKFKPDLVLIVAFVSEEHMLLKYFAEKYGIPIIAISDAKVPGYFVFTQDEYCYKSALSDRFHGLQEGKFQSTSLDKSREFIAKFRKNFQEQIYADDKKKEGWIRRLRHQLAPYKQIFDWYTKKKPRMNYISTIGPTIDYKPPKIILRDFFRKKQYAKFAKNYKYYPLEKVGKFVFYPLKFTPEGNADLMCPLYNNQIELARQIAMSLPDDYTLVAKEHWGMVGLRTPSYLEKVARTPNVKLVDYRISSEELIKKSDMVISTYSTCLFEAAFYNKPAIMLGQSGIFELLPNVFRHSDLTTLTKKIKEVLSLDLKTDGYERQLENYISAVYDEGYDFNYAAAWERGEGDKDALWQIYKKEIEKSLFGKHSTAK